MSNFNDVLRNSWTSSAHLNDGKKAIPMNYHVLDEEGLERERIEYLAAVRRVEAQQEGKTFRRKAWGSSVPTPAQQRRSGSLTQRGKQRTTSNQVKRRKEAMASPRKRPQSATQSSWSRQFGSQSNATHPKALFTQSVLSEGGADEGFRPSRRPLYRPEPEAYRSEEDWADSVRSRRLQATPPQNQWASASSARPRSPPKPSDNPWAAQRGARAVAASSAFSASLAQRLEDKEAKGYEEDFDFDVEIEDLPDAAGGGRPAVGPKLLWAAKRGGNRRRRPQSASTSRGTAPPAASAAPAVSVSRPRKFTASAMSSLGNDVRSYASEVETTEGFLEGDAEYAGQGSRTLSSRSDKKEAWGIHGKSRKKEAKFTQPKPFSTLTSGGHSTAAGIAAEKRKKDLEEYRRRLEGEDVLSQPRFKAREPPKTTTEPLFMKMMEDSERRRQERKELFTKESTQRVQPFNGMEQRQREAARKAAEAKEKAAAMHEHRMRASAFRAKANPFKTDNKTWKEIKEEQEKMRKERVKAEAAKRFRESSLPPRMAEHEQRRKEEEERKKKLEMSGGMNMRASLKSTKSSTSQRSTGSGGSDVKIGRDPPDFKKLHDKWEKKLQTKKQTRRTIPAKPFSFEEKRKQREEKARERKLALERELEEQRLRDPYAPTKTLRSSTSLTSDEIPAVASTRTMRLRQQAMQEKKQKEEEAARLEQEERRLREKKRRHASKAIKPVIENLEAKRRDGRDSALAWEIKSGDITADAKRKARQRAAEFQAATRRNADRIRESLENRPMLLDRAAIEARKEAARQRALITVAQSARGTARAAGVMSSMLSEARRKRSEEEAADDGIDAALGEETKEGDGAHKPPHLAEAGINDEDAKYLL